MPRTIAYRAGGFTNCGIGYTKFSQEELAEMKDRVMTENEAIEELKYDCNELGKAIPCDTSWGKSFENAYAMAINALEEIEQYRTIGTPEECRTAREKQMPKKPIMKQLFKYMEEIYWCCPTCGGILTDRIPADNKTFYFHCMNCGQKFDWSNEE